MTMSPKRRSPARRRTRVGVSLQLVAMLAAGVALVAAPFGVATQSAGAAPLGATALASNYGAQLGAPVQRADLAPLRNSTGISCVKTNCLNGGGDDDGVRAIDFLGQRGDPIYAAGAGILHIGANERTRGTSTTQSAGVWVWVDHGGGRVTKYTHLDSIVATEGHLSPRPPSSAGWATGATSPRARPTTCTSRCASRASADPRVDPRSLKVCTESAGQVSLPGALQRRHVVRRAAQARLPDSRRRRRRASPTSGTRPPRSRPSRRPSAVLREADMEHPAGPDDIRADRHPLPEPERWSLERGDDLHDPHCAPTSTTLLG